MAAGGLAPSLVSPKDLEQVKANPLPRARASFEQALRLFLLEEEEKEEDVGTDSNNNNNNNKEEMAVDEFGLVSARLSMAYVCLELRDYQTALDYAKLVLKKKKHATTTYYYY